MMPEVAARGRSTSQRVRADFPDPVPHGPRQAARLSRQRGHDAEAAARCSTRSRRYYTDDQRQRASRRPRAERSGRPTRYEAARERVRAYFNAASTREIVFTRNATEGHQPGRLHVREADRLKAGDEVLISAMEHHSNIVPWQLVCEAAGARLARGADRRSRRSSLLDEFERLLDAADADRVDHAHVERARHDHARRARSSGSRTPGACPS